MHRPQVLFETSVLGYASHGSAYRTGVFRMVEEWAKELVGREGIGLNFGSFLDERTSLRTNLYCHKTLELSHTPFIPDSLPRRLLSRTDGKFLTLAQDANPDFFKKIYRRSLKEVIDIAERFLKSEQVLDKKPVDIFHSTYWPFPHRNKKNKYLMTFVDLINLVRPDLSTDGGEFFKKVLNTVHSEDFTVSISESTRKDLLSLRPDLNPARCLVAPLAASEIFRPIDPTQLGARLSPYLLKPYSYVLSVCTLEKRKNLPFLIEAFAQWTSLAPFKDMKLVLTGARGTAVDQIKRKIVECKIENRVILLGYVPDAELAPLYAGSLAFVLPSLYEGFGLPVLEALQTGAVVVASNNSSIPEVGGEAVLYMDPTKIDSLVSALEIASSESRRKERTELGLKQASEFSWKKSTDVLMSLYRQMATH